jgi:microcystin-dependent protein
LKICPPPGEAIDIYCDATDVGYRNLGLAIGSYWDYAGSAVPVWVSGCSVPPYLLCDGSTYSAVTYPQLNAILGTTTLPDAQARARIALGGSTGRVTTAGSGIDGTTRFSAGGTQNTTITSTQMPAHTHTQEGQQPTFGYTQNGNVSTGGGSTVVATLVSSGGNPLTTTADATPGTTGSAGGSDALILMQPTYVGGITMIRAA